LNSHQATLVDGSTWNVVAAANGPKQPFVASRKFDRCEHISNACAARDEGRAPVDHPVPNLARIVVACMSRQSSGPFKAALNS